MKGFFKKVVVAVFLLYLVYILMPYAWHLMCSQEELDALSWNGYGGWVSFYGPIPYIITGVTLISLVGLHQLKRWGRTLFLIIVIISGLITPMFGLIVQGGFDSLISYFLVIGIGAIISMSYFSSITEQLD
ncbi:MULTISPECIES: hypothetical protein [unclassified Pseudomonas]|uniref:hypothetical protein n=1 Tax=unclassified Pseudomonas TaxID=196821 RepID=UPI00244D1A04|nr:MULTISPECIES: hypothetical protein [unclassified Pseudomonas]MDH0894838.1 hypothetical protein [Pseudomonas sp. GD03875]MDH1063964.1 hypothetical protein [Pseudomonas sp. GD03985]